MTDPDNGKATIRHLSYRDRRDVTPPGHCMACRQPITDPGRSATCSKACGQFVAFVVRNSTQRRFVNRRDRGICTVCGVDTGLQRRLKYLAGNQRSALGLSGRRWNLPAGWGQWEMDHIVPVCEGGGPSWELSIDQMMDNLRTLCQRCHAKATGKLHRRRALVRRGTSKLDEIL